MTRKVFWENPYLTTHDTVIETVQGQEVGRIRLKRNNIGGGKERIEIFLE